MSNRKVFINLFLSFLAAFLIYSAIFLNPYFVWVAFVPLILLSWYNFFKKGLLFFLLSSFLISVSGVYWVANFDKKYFYLAAFYILSFFFFFSLLLGLIFSRVRNYYSFLVPASLYILLYWFYSFFGVGEYGFNLAVLQPRFGYISQAIGGYGLIFLILLFNSLLAFFIINRRRYSYLVIISILSLALWSGNYYAHHKIPQGQRVRVALIQGDFPEAFAWRAENAGGVVLDKYIELTKKVAEEKVDLVIWPEYAIPTNLEIQPEISNKISNLARELRINLIFGATANDGLPDDNGETSYFNAAYGFDRQGNSLGRYDSLKPFNFKSRRSIGEGYWIFLTDVGKIGVMICFDEFFDQIPRDYNKLGVDYFVAISNNEPVKNYLVKRWLKRFSELRAATYQKYYIRTTNTGFSQVVNPYGIVVRTLPDNQLGVLVSDIYLKN